jgi:CheY-like chemotaxis protein
MTGTSAHEGDSRRLHVLVVEDHADCAQSTALLVGLFGHDVEVAPDGPAALRQIEGHAPDVVLLDIGLPCGLDGWQLARHIRAAHERRPVLIATTGFGTREDLRRSAEAGIDLHLTKPVDPQFLELVLGRFRRMLLD